MAAINRSTVIAPLPLTERGRGVHLGGTLKDNRLLYANERLVVQRNLVNTNDCSICVENHSVKVEVAKFSPNGEWIASGDTSGLVTVWAHQSFVKKNEIQAARCVRDIAWSHDGQRIFAVGEGKEEKAKVFPWNTNNKLGDISGSSKGYIACDFKPSRPFRIIAGGEDNAVYTFEGPPFRFSAVDKGHKKYVNSVRYKPGGEVFVSASSDSLIRVYDGRSGEHQRDIVDKDNGHKGSIYELCFNADGSQFVTCSADKTCKLWDFESGTVVHTWSFSDNPSRDDMQVGLIWLGEWIVSLSLSGKLNFLQPGQERPTRVLTGHRKGINCVSVDKRNNVMYTGDVDSRVVKTECKTCDMEDFVGNPHNDSHIKFVRVTSDGEKIYTVGVDDNVVLTPVAGLQFSDQKVKLDGACRGLVTGTSNPNLAVAITHKKKIYIFNGIEVANVTDVDFDPNELAISPEDNEIAIGSDNGTIYIFDISSGAAVEKQRITSSSLQQQAKMTALKYSPNGKFLASSDTSRHIWLWDRSNGTYGDKPHNEKHPYRFHNSTVLDLSFSDDGEYMASTGNDCSIFVFLKVNEGHNERVKLDNAFNDSAKAIEFLDKNRLVGVSSDATIRFFDIAV